MDAAVSISNAAELVVTITTRPQRYTFASSIRQRIAVSSFRNDRANTSSPVERYCAGVMIAFSDVDTVNTSTPTSTESVVSGKLLCGELCSREPAPQPLYIRCL